MRVSERRREIVGRLFVVDISQFSYVPDLVNGLEVILIIKGFDQLAIVEKIIARKGDRRQGLTAANNVSERRYSQGIIARVVLPSTILTEEHLSSAIWHLDCVEPFDVDVYDRNVACSTGSEVRIRRDNREIRTIKSDWMSFIHSVEFSEDGENILIAAAGFDTIFECRVETGDVVWEWNAWDHGFNQSATGMTFITRLPRQASVFADQHGQNNVLYVRNPNEWPPEGIPTPSSPVRLNGASYGDGIVLTTCYHRPELFLISRDGSFRTVTLGLRNPHSFQKIQFRGQGRYWVTDSGSGRILILDDDFQTIESLDFTSLDAEERKRAKFGEWLQTSSIMQTGNHDVVMSVDALRCGLHIVDVTSSQRRFIGYPPNWTVQRVIPVSDSSPPL